MLLAGPGGVADMTRSSSASVSTIFSRLGQARTREVVTRWLAPDAAFGVLPEPGHAGRARLPARG